MDAIFKAMADPARRDILDALREEDGQTLSALTARFEMTRFGVMKHLGVLEEAGLLTTVKKGRFKYHYLNAVPLQEALDRWIAPFAKPAAQGLLSLKAQLENGAKTATLEIFIASDLPAVWRALTGQTDLTLTARADLQALHTVCGDTPLTFRLARERAHTRLTLTTEERARDDGLRRLAALKTLIETGTEHSFRAPPPAAPDLTEPSKETPK